MSSSLTYYSIRPVPDDVRLQLQAESLELAPRERWWVERIAFFESPELPGHIVGDSKVMLLGYERNDGEFTEVEPADDMIMAYRSARFITSALKTWSRRYGIQWRLEFDGFPLGTIRWGFLSLRGIAIFAAAGAFVRREARVLRLGPAIRRIAHTHQARWDETGA